MASVQGRTWALASFAVSVVVALVAVVWLPGLLYPALTPHELQQIPSGRERVEAQQNQYQIQGSFRSQLLQCLGGLVVVTGAAAGWQQLRIAHEGQITERFTRAIDHLGSSTLDVRLGGIYALERVARNSPADRSTVTYILGAFIREHAPWQVGAPDGPQHPTPTVDHRLPWLSTRASDIQTALQVLGRRPESSDEKALYLSRVDLRRAHLPKARFKGAILRYSNMAHAYLVNIVLEESQLAQADLRNAHLQGAQLANADLRGAHLQNADLRGADLRGANMTNARLDGADLDGALSDRTTIWPDARPPA